MAEILSPSKQRFARIQSPTAPFLLSPNDDKLERAQSRAARSAAIRRKLISAHATPPPGQNPDPCLDKQQILDLFHNCIKLASENKINQKNTWELNLIDHLCEIIKVEEEEDVETNFQKASCTLEAGVKIYSLRVDSVHSEAYKVLGGINRAGQENEQDTIMEDGNIDNTQAEGHSKKETERKLSSLSTLESSFEALNVKKFDVAFAVDPLYHQTSAQFDEGGAKGLLLNNLGVYEGCQVLFDSQEVPGKFTSCQNQHERQDTIDLSFARDFIEQMVLNMRMKEEISPTLASIINQFDEDNKRPLCTFPSLHKSADEVEKNDETYIEEVDFDGNAFGTGGTRNFDHDDVQSVVDDNPYGADTSLPIFIEDNEPFSFHGPDIDDTFEKVDEYLFSSLRFMSKQNAWAGPDHWKYRKAKGSEDNSNEKGSPGTTRRPKAKKQADLDIDFTKAMNEKMPDVFAPPKNPKSLLLPSTRAPPCSTTLPEDCHYQPENLVKLFLLPNIMCLRKTAKRHQDELRQQSNDYGAVPSWDDGSVFGGEFDDGNSYSDVQDPNALVSQPRQVNKSEIQYDKTSKQVDVQTLKETLWHHLQESRQMSFQEQEALSFKNLLSSFPSDCSAAAAIRDISPHLCFICLLHLANEHGLSIRGCAGLDDLRIHLPMNDLHVDEVV